MLLGLVEVFSCFYLVYLPHQFEAKNRVSTRNLIVLFCTTGHPALQQAATFCQRQLALWGTHYNF